MEQFDEDAVALYDGHTNNTRTHTRARAPTCSSTMLLQVPDS